MDRDQLRDQVFLEVALGISRLATCDRLHVGAVLVNPARKIISTGYNGAPSKLAHCDQVGHRIINGSCLRSVHAEANAIQQAQEDGRATAGATLYCTHFTCIDCAKDVIRATVARFVYVGDYHGDQFAAVLDMFTQAGVKVDHVQVSNA